MDKIGSLVLKAINK